MCPPVMPKWDSMPGGGSANRSTTSSEVPGANRSQISRRWSTYPSSASSQVVSAGAYGTDCTNSADEWLP